MNKMDVESLESVPESEASAQDGFSAQVGMHALVSDTGRLLAYSDAIFSIIATVMILPLTHSQALANPQEDLHDALIDITPKIFIYGLTFMIVCAIWASHVALFEIVSKTDDIIAIFNLAIMMIVTFLPFTSTLLGHYPMETFAVVLFNSCMLLIGLVQVFFIYHAFNSQYILKNEIRFNMQKSQIKKVMYLNAGLNPAISIISLILATFTPVSFYLIIFMGMHIMVKKIIISLYFYLSKANDASSYLRNSSVIIDLKAGFPKERVEAFSDGVFAIVATLIILDISEDAVPDKKEIEEAGSLIAALSKNSRTFFAYGGTFVTVAILWFCHYSLFHYVKRVSRIMVFYNNLCLGCIGVLPLAFQLTSKFDFKHENSEVYAIQITCAIVFLAGIFQLIIFVSALCDAQKHLASAASVGGQSHFYLIVKLLIYPLISLLVYFLSVEKKNLTVIAFSGMQVATPVLYILLKVISVALKKCTRPNLQISNELKSHHTDDDENEIVT